MATVDGLLRMLLPPPMIPGPSPHLRRRQLLGRNIAVFFRGEPAILVLLIVVSIHVAIPLSSIVVAGPASGQVLG